MHSQLKRWAPLVIVVSVGVAIISTGTHKYLSLEALADNRTAMRRIVSEHYLLALVGYALIYALAVALSLPGGLILTLTGGLLFGWMIGGSAAIAGATIGATIVFIVAKSAFGEALAVKAGPRLEGLRDGFRQDALNYLLFLRLVPAFPFWLVNLAPALLGVPLGTYILGTAIGIIPGTLAFASVGAGLDSIIATAQAEQAKCILERATSGCSLSISAASLVGKHTIFAFTMLGIVSLIPVVIKRFVNRPNQGA